MGRPQKHIRVKPTANGYVIVKSGGFEVTGISQNKATNELYRIGERHERIYLGRGA